MDRQVNPLADLAAHLDQITQGLNALVDRVATELRRPPPVNAERIEEAVLDLTGLTRTFFAFFQHLTQVQAEEVARQRSSGGPGVLPLEWQRFQTQAGLLRMSMNQWSKIRDLIREQAPSKRKLDADTEREWSDYVSSHPATKARIMRFRELENPE